MSTFTIDVDGHKLHPIICVDTFRLANGSQIRANEYGGYIESEANLSQTGKCWIMNSSKVYENASVKDDAIVYGNANIYGDATIEDNVKVSGKAKVYGNAIIRNNCIVKDNAQIYGNALLYHCVHAMHYVKIYGNSIVGQPNNHMHKIMEIVGVGLLEEGISDNEFGQSIIMKSCNPHVSNQDHYGFIKYRNSEGL